MKKYQFEFYKIKGGKVHIRNKAIKDDYFCGLLYVREDDKKTSDRTHVCKICQKSYKKITGVDLLQTMNNLLDDFTDI